MIQHHLDPKNIAVIGANGAIGHALIATLSGQYPNASIHGFARRSTSQSFSNSTNAHSHLLPSYDDETALLDAAHINGPDTQWDWVIVATGLLHTLDVKPEKSLKQVTPDALATLFQANTIVPALIAKYFVPRLSSHPPSVFAALSARVGSISDNRLGGWYGYRASKAALNMIIKTTAIECQRRYPNAIIVGLHPGTVDSALSKPFQRNVPENQLFDPTTAATHLIQVITSLNAAHSGRCIDWQGQEVLP